MANKVGIDIGTSSIKILELDSSGYVVSQSILANPTGKNLSLMTNAEKLALTEVIKNGLVSAGIKTSKVVVSVPDSLVYSKVMQFPKMSSPELATAIKWELDQNVPFPPNEVEMSWSLMDKLKKKEGDMSIAYVVAVPTKISEAYVQVFDLLEMEIERLENESVSAQRALSSFVQAGGLCLAVDFGFSGANVVLFNEESIVNSYHFSVGGSATTKLIADTFGLSFEQAENYKRTYGMVAEQLDGKMFGVLKPVVDSLILEFKKMLTAYKSDYGEFGSLRIVMAGGGSFLSGLAPYVSSALDGTEVVIGNVFDGKQSDPNLMSMGQVYLVAYGLAM